MNRLLTIASAVFALITVHPVSSQAAEWQIDTSHSAAQFSVRHMMVSTVRGGFDTMTGTVNYDPNEPAKTSVEATVDISSVNTRQEKRDAHLRSPDFFDVEKYPTMTFRSTKIESVGEGMLKMTGNLTIRDNTKEVVFDVQGVTPPVAISENVQRMGATATTKISRKDFGLTWNRVLEAGGVTVGDEVTITVDVELVHKVASAEATS